MKTTSYSSVAANKTSSLSEKTWQVFSPFISRYQWALDSPSHSPRKTEIASAILNRGKTGSCTFTRDDGDRFILRPLAPWVFVQSINNHCKLYYVSCGSVVLIYFDIDIHKDWQTPEDAERARQLLEHLFVDWFGKRVIFWNQSNRGVNGYLKVNLLGLPYRHANEVFARLENAVRLFLASHRNMADFELKGRIGYLDDDGEYKWAQYGKLPIHVNWTVARLEEFKNTPMASLRSLELLCGGIEALIHQKVLDEHNQLKRIKGDEPMRQDSYFVVTPAIEQALVEKHGEAWRCMFAFKRGDDEVWLHERYYRPGQAPITEWELRKERDDLRHTAATDGGADRSGRAVRPGSDEPGAGQPRTSEDAGDAHRHDPGDVPVSRRTAGQRGPFNIDCSDLTDEPDSFERQREALLRLARYLKRVPSIQEGLDFLHQKRLYTGAWEHNLARRTTRVHAILQFIAKTFDAAKIKSGSVDVGKYDEWALKKFPRGIVGLTKSRLTEYGELVPGQTMLISPQFIAFFMAIADFCLLTNKNEDSSLPHRRAEELWKELHARGVISIAFCARKWAACRGALVEHGIIKITDRDYCPGKAMRWDVGTFFPGLGQWKGSKLCGLGIPLVRRKRRTEQRHNTLLRQQSGEEAISSGLLRSRPPP